MTYDEWEVAVPRGMKDDAVWRVQAFRLASYLAASADRDSEAIANTPRLGKAAAQLASATASIAANVAEGYTRLSPKDRIRYYEYALGSAAEAKAWYVTLARSLDAPVVDARLAVLTSITRLLLKMIRSGRLQSPPAAPQLTPTSPSTPNS